MFGIKSFLYFYFGIIRVGLFSSNLNSDYFLFWTNFSRRIFVLKKIIYSSALFKLVMLFNCNNMILFRIHFHLIQSWSCIERFTFSIFIPVDNNHNEHFNKVTNVANSKNCCLCYVVYFGIYIFTSCCIFILYVKFIFFDLDIISQSR